MTEDRYRKFRGIVAIAIVLSVVGAIWTFVSIASAPADLVSEQAAAPAVSLTPDQLAAAQIFRPFDSSVPVVAYHDITDSGSVDSITPEQFGTQMAMLDQAGFVTITLEQARSLVMGEEIELPGNPILLTFDGGDLSTWVHADPILAQHGFNGVVFVATSELQTQIGGAHLNIDTLRKMRTSGRWEIGGNAHLGDQLLPTESGDVPWFTNRLTRNGRTETVEEWRERVRVDLATNRAQLQSRLGVDAFAIAYPTPNNALISGDPDLTPIIPELIGEQFVLGFSIGENPVSISDASVVTLMQRVRGFGVNTDPIALLGAIDESLPRSPAGSITPTAWVIGGQGECLSGNDTLIISDEGYTSCRLQTASADQWSDVRTSAIISGISPDAAASIRVRDNGSNRLEVTVSSQRVVVEQFTDDIGMELASMSIDLSTSTGVTPILIEVRGTLLMVTLDGAPPLRIIVAPPARSGAVSFAGRTSGAGVVTFTNLNIINFEQTDTASQPNTPSVSDAPG